MVLKLIYKYFIFLLSLLILMNSCGQFSEKLYTNKQKIILENVEFINIRKQVSDSAHCLNSNQCSAFVDKWNNAEYTGLGIYMASYVIEVKLKDGEYRSFRINGASIKENTDYCFDLGDSKFIEALWINSYATK